MRRQKPERRAAFARLPRCYSLNPQLKGRWRLAHGFDPQAELIVELAAGRADFAIGLAQLNPQAMVIAIDSKAERLWAGATRGDELNLANLHFLRQDILVLGELFDPHEISRLWITFPDPFPKARHARRRLTAPYYWDLYRRLIAPGGRVEFKTDDPDLFDYTLAELEALSLSPQAVIRDLHAHPAPPPEALTLTAYERRFLAEGRRTHYLSVAMP